MTLPVSRRLVVMAMILAMSPLLLFSGAFAVRLSHRQMYLRSNAGESGPRYIFSVYVGADQVMDKWWLFRTPERVDTMEKRESRLRSSRGASYRSTEWESGVIAFSARMEVLRAVFWPAVILSWMYLFLWWRNRAQLGISDGVAVRLLRRFAMSAAQRTILALGFAALLYLVLRPHWVTSQGLYGVNQRGYRNSARRHFLWNPPEREKPIGYFNRRINTSRRNTEVAVASLLTALACIITWFVTRRSRSFLRGRRSSRNPVPGKKVLPPTGGGQQSSSCPNCGQNIPPHAALCVGCGYDRRAGVRHPTRIIEASKKPQIQHSARPNRGLQFLAGAIRTRWVRLLVAPLLLTGAATFSILWRWAGADNAIPIASSDFVYLETPRRAAVYHRTPFCNELLGRSHEVWTRERLRRLSSYRGCDTCGWMGYRGEGAQQLVEKIEQLLTKSSRSHKSSTRSSDGTGRDIFLGQWGPVSIVDAKNGLRAWIPGWSGLAECTLTGQALVAVDVQRLRYRRAQMYRVGDRLHVRARVLYFGERISGRFVHADLLHACDYAAELDRARMEPPGIVPTPSSAFCGKWTNKEYTGSIDHFQIDMEGNRCTIQMWGQCASRPCERGTSSARVIYADPTRLAAQWEWEYGVEYCELRLLDEQRMEVFNTSEYDGRQGRSGKRTTTLSFQKAKEEPERPTKSVNRARRRRPS